MNTIDSGGPAFPVNYSNEGDGPTVMPDAGMSLRDYFAAKELTRVSERELAVGDIHEAYGRLARHCYRMADSMLEARQS